MKTPTLLTGLSALLLLSACGENSGDAHRGEPKPLQVDVASVTRQALGQTITSTGTLRAEREVKLITEEEGRIAKLPFHEGAAVSKGELLVQLDDNQLRAELKKARAQRKQAQLDVKRLERLQHSRVISEDELARARTALDVALAEEELLRTRLGNTRITAPFEGVISQRLAEPGDAVAKFTHLLTLSATDSLLAELSVSELMLPGLEPGDSVTIHIDALGDLTFDGKILRIHPKVDPVTRQGVVEVLMEQPPEQARPGQLCRVKLQLRPQSRLIVPFSALRRDTQGEFVYRVDEGPVAHRTSVISGIHLGEAVEILEGLQEGQTVVSNGFLGLSDGKAITLSGQRAAASSEP